MEWWEFLLVMLVMLPILVLWLGCIIDVIARPDLNGWVKALWALAILFFPLFGSLVYIIVRPRIIVAPRTESLDDGWASDPGTFPSSGNSTRLGV